MARKPADISASPCSECITSGTRAPATTALAAEAMADCRLDAMPRRSG